MSRRVLGEEHPFTLMIAHNLATTLFGQAKFAEAKETLKATLEARRRVLATPIPIRLTLHRA